MNFIMHHLGAMDQRMVTKRSIDSGAPTQLNRMMDSNFLKLYIIWFSYRGYITASVGI